MIEGALENHTELEVQTRKNDVEGLPYVVKNPLQLPMDPVKDQLFPCAQLDFFG